jgi:fumarate reductase subunit C
MMKHPDTWTWLLQVISAMVILLLVTIHIWVNIKTLPINATTSATRMNAGGWWLVYVILLPMLGIHVSVGFYRICVKWGLFKRSGRPWFQRIEILMGLGFVLLGVITMLRFLALAP